MAKSGLLMWCKWPWPPCVSVESDILSSLCVSRGRALWPLGGRMRGCRCEIFVKEAVPVVAHQTGDFRVGKAHGAQPVFDVGEVAIVAEPVGLWRETGV